MNNTPVRLSYIKDLADVKIVQLAASMRLIKYGAEVGNTRECSLEAHYVSTPALLKTLLPKLRAAIPKDVWAREKEEYKELQALVVDRARREFKRDITGRRAITVSFGCITYQHSYIRRGTLIHVVHMRGMDTRKFIADLYYMFRAANAVATLRGFPVNFIHLHLLVDCFHTYTQEVPL